MRRIAANRATCEGTGFCEQVAPNLFRVDEEGLVEQVASDVSDAELEIAREARDLCPTRSIFLHDD